MPDYQRWNTLVSPRHELAASAVVERRVRVNEAVLELSAYRVRSCTSAVRDFAAPVRIEQVSDESAYECLSFRTPPL
jgi:hypothetical protein